MNPLDLLIAESGLTQKEVAERIGVSPVSVHKWVTRKAPIPPDRARALEVVLRVPDGTLSSMETGGPKGKTHTVFAFLLDELVEGEWDDKVKTAAEASGYSVPEVLSWVTGARRIPVTAARDIMGSMLPGLNPAVLTNEVAEYADESVALDAALDALSADTTFVEALARLQDAAVKFATFPYVERSKRMLFAMLDDGRSIPQALKDRARL